MKRKMTPYERDCALRRLRGNASMMARGEVPPGYDALVGNTLIVPPTCKYKDRWETEWDSYQVGGRYYSPTRRSSLSWASARYGRNWKTE